MRILAWLYRIPNDKLQSEPKQVGSKVFFIRIKYYEIRRRSASWIRFEYYDRFDTVQQAWESALESAKNEFRGQVLEIREIDTSAELKPSSDLD